MQGSYIGTRIIAAEQEWHHVRRVIRQRWLIRQLRLTIHKELTNSFMRKSSYKPMHTTLINKREDDPQSSWRRTEEIVKKRNSKQITGQTSYQQGQSHTNVKQVFVIGWLTLSDATITSRYIGVSSTWET